jgi:protein-S-isoprenylcysteine O-methyltransferase Ste14
MKLGITKEELPILIDGMRRSIGSMFVGIGLGMFFALGYFPEAERKSLPSHFFATAVSFLLVGIFMASFSWRKARRKDSVDAKHVV